MHAHAFNGVYSKLEAYKIGSFMYVRCPVHGEKPSLRIALLRTGSLYLLCWLGPPMLVECFDLRLRPHPSYSLEADKATYPTSG